MASAHEHHFEGAKGKWVSEEPIDSILWIHILLQTFAWGILFPTGMVLGIIRSRWHVPVQILASGLAVLGWFLGHMHKGRQFSPSAHSHFAKWLMLMLIIQAGLGIYLKLHLERGFQGRVRKYFVFAHGVVGKVLPVAAWVQMLFGGIAALGFCHDDHMGQCLAHFIMGSAFIGYGILLTILLLVGQAWLKRTGRSQEFFDSLIIAAWGCVNTFTEHRWGHEWAHNDIQHTTMGVIWWCAGLLGMWLSRKRDGRPKRNIIPALVIILTGYAMSAHPQHLPISTMLHTVFGYTLMAAGLTRLIEISFVLQDRSSVDEKDGEEISSFQHLPPFLLYAAGFLFMGATEEQMALLDQSGIDHVSYLLILYSIAFLLYLFVNMLLHLFAVNAQPSSHIKLDPEDGRPTQNGYARANGHAHSSSMEAERARAREAEEFELHGLTSDDEEGDDAPLVHKETQRAERD